MKLISGIAAALLLPAGLARHVRVRDKEPDDGRLEQRLKVNAFTIREDGMPTVECWEVGDEFTPSDASNGQGLAAQGRHVRIAGPADLSAVSVATWPGRTRIWPPHHARINDAKAGPYCFGCLGAMFGCPMGGGFQVQCGAYSSCGNFYGRSASESDIGVENNFDRRLVLTPENGNNWFYFNDDRAGAYNYSDILAAEAHEPPFTITTIGMNDGQLLTIEFDRFKNKTKLHNGICTSAGIDIPEEDGSGKHTQFEVNFRIQDL